MKEYKVECKTRYIENEKWWMIGELYNTIEEAKERMEQEKRYDKFYKKNPEDWMYRIMVRDVPDWEIYKDGN